MSDDATTPDHPAGTVRDWVRRIVIALALAFGVWLLVIAAGRTDNGLESAEQDSIVEDRFPPADGQAPSQSQVGVTFAPGYEGTMRLNGVEIPEDQLEGALDPETMSAQDLEQHGIRPNNRNRVWFSPGPGKVLETLPRGELVISVDYHRDRQPGVGAGNVTWRITVY